MTGKVSIALSFNIIELFCYKLDQQCYISLDDIIKSGLFYSLTNVKVLS